MPRTIKQLQEELQILLDSRIGPEQFAHGVRITDF